MKTTPLLRAGCDTLQVGEHRVWRSRRGATLRVQHGRIWVTASHRLDDHFLDVGMSLVLPPHASVLIGAESDARLRLELPSKHPWPWTGWWARLVGRGSAGLMRAAGA